MDNGWCVVCGVGPGAWGVWCVVCGVFVVGGCCWLVVGGWRLVFGGRWCGGWWLVTSGCGLVVGSGGWVHIPPHPTPPVHPPHSPCAPNPYTLSAPNAPHSTPPHTSTPTTLPTTCFTAPPLSMTSRPTVHPPMRPHRYRTCDQRAVIEVQLREGQHALQARQVTWSERWDGGGQW